MSAKSIESKSARQLSKPKKPNKKFSLFAHDSGQWAKKIRGRLHYFGSWRTDPSGTAAEATFDREWPFLKDGKSPPAVDVSGGCSLRVLCNDFLASKEEKLKADELSPRTFRDYHATCESLIKHFGKDRIVADLRPDDFRGFRASLAKRLGVVSLKNEINRVCIVFNHAHENNLIEKPVSYGSNFDRPSAKALRKNRNEAGPKLFERDECLRILDALNGKPVKVEDKPKPVALTKDPILRAMFLLGLNGGLGNSDCANLRESHIDFAGGWLNYPRVKTEIPRRIPLWPETVAALQAALTVRPTPADASSRGLVFLTRLGNAWVRVKEKEKPTPTSDDEKRDDKIAVPIDAISGEFKKVLHALGINGRRGIGFYTARHTFETMAGESRDQVAVDSIMGHVDSSMAANYRHRISDERLKAVVETVWSWLFSPTPEVKTEGGAQ